MMNLPTKLGIIALATAAGYFVMCSIFVWMDAPMESFWVNAAAIMSATDFSLGWVSIFVGAAYK